MNKIVEEYERAYTNMKELIRENNDNLYDYRELYVRYKEPSFIHIASFHYHFEIKKDFIRCWYLDETIDIPLNFFDNPSQFVKDFEAKCIEEQKQKDIDVELKDKENRRKQFLKLQEEFKDEM